MSLLSATKALNDLLVIVDRPEPKLRLTSGHLTCGASTGYVWLD